MEYLKVGIIVIGIILTTLMFFGGTIEKKLYASKKRLPSESIQVDGLDSVVRFIDPEFQVVCYSASRYSVSCAPLPKAK